MNRIWLFTISISILYAMINHNLDAMNEVMMQVGKDTFDFVVPLLCVASPLGTSMAFSSSGRLPSGKRISSTGPMT